MEIGQLVKKLKGGDTYTNKQYELVSILTFDNEAKQTRNILDEV
jgi:hypothetical protein